MHRYSVVPRAFQPIRFNRSFSKVADGDLKRVCIIGSGPAGFYTAKYLLKEHGGVHIDMFESLPTPYGVSFYRAYSYQT